MIAFFSSSSYNKWKEEKTFYQLQLFFLPAFAFIFFFFSIDFLLLILSLVKRLAKSNHRTNRRNLIENLTYCRLSNRLDENRIYKKTSYFFVELITWDINENNKKIRGRERERESDIDFTHSKSIASKIDLRQNFHSQSFFVFLNEFLFSFFFACFCSYSFILSLVLSLSLFLSIYI